MFSISKDFTFSASHRLEGLAEDHQCARLHGHNYVVRVTLSSPDLDSTGFVLDYGEMAPIRRWIDDHLDHRHLNDIMEENPTAEHLARFLGLRLPVLLGIPHVTALSVGVSETGKTWATWTDPGLTLSDAEQRAAFPIDQGEEFGLWEDPTSRLMYHDAMPPIVGLIEDRSLPAIDCGGANGLMREWFPDLTTVDIDRSKSPDICADILTWNPGDRSRWPTGILRYVLHYFDDDHAILLLDRLRSYIDTLLLIQFVNGGPDLLAKRRMSINETKWFRSDIDLRLLIDETAWSYREEEVRGIGYWVDPDFYRNRLDHPSPSGHGETIVGMVLR